MDELSFVDGEEECVLPNLPGYVGGGVAVLVIKDGGVIGRVVRVGAGKTFRTDLGELLADGVPEVAFGKKCVADETDPDVFPKQLWVGDRGVLFPRSPP